MWIVEWQCEAWYMRVWGVNVNGWNVCAGGVKEHVLCVRGTCLKGEERAERVRRGGWRGVRTWGGLRSWGEGKWKGMEKNLGGGGENWSKVWGEGGWNGVNDVRWGRKVEGWRDLWRGEGWMKCMRCNCEGVVNYIGSKVDSLWLSFFFSWNLSLFFHAFMHAGVTLLSALIELANGVNYVLDNTQVCQDYCEWIRYVVQTLALLKKRPLVYEWQTFLPMRMTVWVGGPVLDFWHFPRRYEMQLLVQCELWDAQGISLWLNHTCLAAIQLAESLTDCNLADSDREDSLLCICGTVLVCNFRRTADARHFEFCWYLSAWFVSKYMWQNQLLFEGSLFLICHKLFIYFLAIMKGCPFCSPKYMTLRKEYGWYIPCTNKG